MNGQRLTRKRIAGLQNKIGGAISPATGNIRPEDLHPVYQVFATLVGIENALIIGRELGGTNIYLPKLDIEQMIFLRDRNAKIVEEFDGHNHRELAHKHNITDITVREILKRERSHK
jgi:Mor family transcriptional regulator